jgi:hypothetical protein
MFTKIKRIGWYLKQPKGSQLVLNLVRQRTYYKKRENTRTEAEAWCRQLAVDTRTALKQLFHDNKLVYREVEELFPEELQYARRKVETTPYKMGGGGNMSLLYIVCEKIQARYAIETGVAYGWSSLAILLSLNKRSDGMLVSIDMPYPAMGNEDYVGIVIPPQLKGSWRLFREPDISGLPKALKSVPHLDLVHYDSDKSYLGRMISYPKLYDKLRTGGVFVSDDIGDNLAFKHFCDANNIYPVIIDFEKKFVGVFVKGS